MRIGLVFALLLLAIPAAHADDEDDAAPAQAEPERAPAAKAPAQKEAQAPSTDDDAPAEHTPAPAKAAKKNADPASPRTAAPRAAAASADADEDDAEPSTGTCKAPSTLKGDMANAYEAACAFFGDLSNRRLAQMARRLHAPFYFEGKSVAALDDVERRWAKLLAAAGEAPATLYGLDVYTYDDMVKKYGKPPARLEGVPLRGAIIAVANVDGRAQIAGLRRDGNSWMVFAFSD